MTTLFGGKDAAEPMEFEDLVERSYSQWIQLALTALCVGGGTIWLFWSLLG